MDNHEARAILQNRQIEIDLGDHRQPTEILASILAKQAVRRSAVIAQVTGHDDLPVELPKLRTAQDGIRYNPYFA